MSRLIVKVCGMREPENVLALSHLPVDWIGFIFYPQSPRAVQGAVLEKWLNQKATPLRSTLKRVGVFVNAPIEDVLNRVHDYGLDFVQLHGQESPAYCEELCGLWNLTSMRKAVLIKAFSVGEGFDFSQVDAYASSCAYALFDTKTPDFGGSGRTFNWDILQAYTGSLPFLLSGGIGVDVVPAIRALVHPQLAGVDLNSRFEIAPGMKSVARIESFLEDLFQQPIN